MADHIIILDVKRNGEFVPFFELEQMKGRCARNPGDKGTVDIIVSEEDVETIKDKFKNSENLKVESVFNSKETVAFHLIAEIVNGNVKTISDVKKWYNRSFSAFCNKDINITSVIDLLTSCESLEKRKELLFPTKIGEFATRYYFHPLDVKEWDNNFTEVFNKGLEDNNFAISWALSHVHCYGNSINIRGYWDFIEEWKDQVSSLGFDYEGKISQGVIWWSILGGPPLGKLRAEIRDLKEDAERIMSVLKKINEIRKWNDEGFFGNLSVMIKRKVDSDMVKLCSIPGFSKNLYFELYNFGIETEEDIKDKFSFIETYGSEELISKLKSKGFSNGI